MSAIMSWRTATATKNLTGFATISKPKSYAKKLGDDYLQKHANIGVQNAEPVGVVDLWDKVYMAFIATNKLKRRNNNCRMRPREPG